MTNYLKNLSYKELKELIQYLKKDDTEFYPILKKLNYFFPEMNAVQAIMMGNLITSILNNSDDEGYEIFSLLQKSFPEMKIDTEGRSKPNKINYSDINIESLDAIYNEVKDKKDNLSKQIKNAKTLQCLRNIETSNDFNWTKLIYYKKDTLKPLSQEEMKELENNLNNLLGKNNKVRIKFINYIIKTPLKNCKYFVEHFIKRVDCCCKDKELNHPSNSEFLNKLKEIDF